MNKRIEWKIFRQWERNPKRTFKRHGIGRVIKALNGIYIYIYPGNGYMYHLCRNGHINKDYEPNWNYQVEKTKR